MSRSGWIRAVLLVVFYLVATGGPAIAGSAQPTPFTTTRSKASVPVAPKQTISKKNRKAGMVFTKTGTLKTRQIGTGKLSDTNKTLSKIKEKTKN